MRVLALSCTLLALAASSAVASPGDVWILGIDHIDNQGAFTTYAGAGYSGPQSSGNASYNGNSYGFDNGGAPVGTNRVYWELSGNSVNNNSPAPTTTELYSIEFFGTTDSGHNSWQPVESQFKGVNGETYPIESLIPWDGTFGTNHQSMAGSGADDGLWHSLGPGNHTPDSSAMSAGDQGTYMWLTSGSWLYAKWDFGFAIDRSWSAVRVTQVTGVPEPGAIVLGCMGFTALGLAAWRRKRIAKV